MNSNLFEQLQSRLEDSAGSKSDLSAKLIASEEECLKVINLPQTWAVTK